MQYSRLLFTVAILLAPVALFGTTWLYLYPLFDAACAFPVPPDSPTAPFRLLALGDPQLEGDSSLPKPGAPIFPSLDFLFVNVSSAVQAGDYKEGYHLIRDNVQDGLAKKMTIEGIKWVWGKRKWIDLWGNDWYLAHIVRTLRWWSRPSHVAVLGDLLGSQWIKDEEFERRQRRYWDVVFRGMEAVPEYVMTGKEGGEGEIEKKDAEHDENEAETESEIVNEEEKKWGSTMEILGADKRWANRVINIAGNHDIGYAGDVDEARIERFERAFGKVNWDIVFKLPNTSAPSPVDDPTNESSTQHSTPELRLVILNSMNLDTPAWTPSLQTESYEFMNRIVTTARPVTDKTHATILLTHIPFEKKAGVCVDAPLFTFFEGGSGVKEQNMLSDYVTKMMLESIFGLSSNPEAEGGGFGRRGIVINGHDHAGCDVLHWIEQSGASIRCPDDVIFHNNMLNIPVISGNASSNTQSLEFAADMNSTDFNPTETDTNIDSESDSSDLPSPEPEPARFQALRYPPPPYTTTTKPDQCTSLKKVPQIREITLRSMMGDYAGYAGFLSAWFDPKLGEKGEWTIEFSTCGLGTQHWWWVFHIVDLIFVVAVLSGLVVGLVERNVMGERPEGKKVGQKKEGTVSKEEDNKQRTGNEEKNGQLFAVL
jgi:hypothetical protein